MNCSLAARMARSRADGDPSFTACEASVLPFYKSSSGLHLISFLFLFISSQLFPHIHTDLSRRLNLLLSLRFRQILNVKDHPNHQTATRTHSDLFAVS
jgi:hypothetical protein